MTKEIESSTYFNRPPPPFRRPLPARETDPVPLTPGPFSYADDRVELAGDSEVEVEVWDWEGEGWVHPGLGW
jgi:hypothetical protein